VSPDYGEIYAKTDYRFGADDKFTLRGLIFFAPDYNQTGETATWIAGGGGMRLWENVVVYAGGGYQFLRRPECLRAIGLDRRRVLLLEIADLRRALLGHKPERRRMRRAQRI
jgi:hypothetical protein